MNFLIPDDKKPTDADIVKALECCANLEACEKCPMGSMEKYDTDTCEHQIMLYSLDLINRQKEEKEALINGQETLQKHIAEQKAEIEWLKESNRILTQENFWGHQAFEKLKQEKGR